MRFTDSPYEDFMKEKSYFKGVPPNLPPKGSRCDGCPYWHGIGCVFCYREQLQGQRQGANMSRELTRQEKAAIRSLVKRWCANYDKDIGCLPLDCECYMLGKCWTGAYCRYFRSAVLPLDPVLERSLTVEAVRGNPALSGVRQGFSPGRAAAVLFPGLRPCCKAAEAARLYAEIPGVGREHLDPGKLR